MAKQAPPFPRPSFTTRRALFEADEKPKKNTNVSNDRPTAAAALATVEPQDPLETLVPMVSMVFPVNEDEWESKELPPPERTIEPTASSSAHVTPQLDPQVDQEDEEPTATQAVMDNPERMVNQETPETPAVQETPADQENQVKTVAQEPQVSRPHPSEPQLVPPESPADQETQEAPAAQATQVETETQETKERPETLVLKVPLAMLVAQETQDLPAVLEDEALAITAHPLVWPLDIKDQTNKPKDNTWHINSLAYLSAFIYLRHSSYYNSQATNSE